MRFYTNSTERMRLDASGRLGIKTTPSAWTTDYAVIDLNTGGSIYGTTSGVTTASNLYFTGSAWIAKNTGLGTLYAQHSGAHHWYSSASVSAGSAAGLSTKMTLDASGNLGIGTNNPGERLHIGSGHLLFERGGEVRSKDTSGNTKTIARVNSSNQLEYGWSSNGPVKFMGGGSYTERMRIHTNANIGINDIAPAGTLTVTGPRILVQRTNDDSSIAFANNATGAPSSSISSVPLVFM